MDFSVGQDIGTGTLGVRGCYIRRVPEQTPRQPFPTNKIIFFRTAISAGEPTLGLSFLRTCP